VAKSNVVRHGEVWDGRRKVETKKEGLLLKSFNKARNG
jgi:hypothetical protein